MAEKFKQQLVQESEPPKIQEDFVRLQNIVEILREMGFRVVNELINIDTLQSPSSEMGFPIVRDGLDGIRVSYSKRRGLRVWFTNGFENPENPRRQEVEKRLREAGLI